MLKVAYAVLAPPASAMVTRGDHAAGTAFELTYPLTAPAVIPLTKARWKTRNAKARGSVAITPDAISMPQGVLISPCSRYRDNPMPANCKLAATLNAGDGEQVVGDD
jgi:hypothetical protein